MKVKEFAPYLLLMDKGYRDSSNKKNVNLWFNARTDDIQAYYKDGTYKVVVLGTQAKLIEWVWNVAFRSVEWLDMGRVHGGFARNVNRLLGSESDKDSLISLILKHHKNNVPIEILGHSRGGALACLIASKLVYHGVDREGVTIITCGTARVGNRLFRDQFRKLFFGNSFALNGNNDPVTRLPPWGYMNGKVTKIKLGSWFRPKHVLSHYIKAVNEI